MDIEWNSDFFLLCHLFANKWIVILGTLSQSDCKLIQANESLLTKTQLFDNSLFGLEKIILNLNAPINKTLQRFEEPLFEHVLIITTKYSCISYHSFTLLEFFNL